MDNLAGSAAVAVLLTVTATSAWNRLGEALFKGAAPWCGPNFRAANTVCGAVNGSGGDGQF